MDKWLAAYTAARYLDKHKDISAVAEQYVVWINAQASEAVAIKALLEAAQNYSRAERVISEAAELVAAGYVPTASAISPATGTTAGGATVTITGTKLLGVTGVTFGGTAATAVKATSDTTLTCVTPAKTAGAVTVIVTTAFGAVTKTTFYTYA